MYFFHFLNLSFNNDFILFAIFFFISFIHSTFIFIPSTVPNQPPPPYSVYNQTSRPPNVNHTHYTQPPPSGGIMSSAYSCTGSDSNVTTCAPVSMPAERVTVTRQVGFLINFVLPCFFPPFFPLYLTCFIYFVFSSSFTKLFSLFSLFCLFLSFFLLFFSFHFFFSLLFEIFISIL